MHDYNNIIMIWRNYIMDKNDFRVCAYKTQYPITARKFFLYSLWTEATVLIIVKGIPISAMNEYGAGQYEDNRDAYSAVDPVQWFIRNAIKSVTSKNL